MLRHAARHPVAAVQNGLFAHAVHQQRRGAVHQNAVAHLIVPVVVVGKAAQGRLNAADQHRHAGISLVNAVAVDRNRPIGAQARLPARGVYIGIAALFRDRIVVHHAVDHAGGNQKAKLGLTEALESLGAVILRQAQHGHMVARVFQHAPDDRVPKGRMIHIGLANHIQKIRRVPAALGNLLGRNGQKGHSANLQAVGLPPL